MKLKNTTDFPDYFLRRMVSWCCKQLDYSSRNISEAQFRNRSDSCASGCAYGSQRFVVSIGNITWINDGTGDGSRTKRARRTIYERANDLVRVTAHEIFHLKAHREGINSRNYGRSSGSSERQTCWHEQKILEAFKTNRESLMDKWLKPPVARTQRPRKTLQEQRAEKANNSLIRWQRKLKLAQTKVKQYKQKVRYYEKAIAAKRGEA